MYKSHKSSIMAAVVAAVFSQNVWGEFKIAEPDDWHQRMVIPTIQVIEPEAKKEGCTTVQVPPASTAVVEDQTPTTAAPEPEFHPIKETERQPEPTVAQNTGPHETKPIQSTEIMATHQSQATNVNVVVAPDVIDVVSSPEPIYGEKPYGYKVCGYNSDIVHFRQGSLEIENRMMELLTAKAKEIIDGGHDVILKARLGLANRNKNSKKAALALGMKVRDQLVRSGVGQKNIRIFYSSTGKKTGWAPACNRRVELHLNEPE
jgi:hypothetical protein